VGTRAESAVGEAGMRKKGRMNECACLSLVSVMSCCFLLRCVCLQESPGYYEYVAKTGATKVAQ
jgi:hypothetical protein